MSANDGARSYFTENKAYAGLGRASLHSGMVFVIARGGNIFVQLASTILLARILSPHDFGVVAVVLALVGFAPMLIDLGTSEASTQKTLITTPHISTLFWLNMAIGVALTVLLIGSSGLIARIFGEPAITGIAMALVGHLCADRDVQPALRADAPGHAVSSHRDDRYFRQSRRQHRQRGNGAIRLGILVAGRKADRDSRLDRCRRLDQLPLGTRPAAYLGRRQGNWWALVSASPASP